MKKYDVVARIGSYTDNQNQEKGRFENVGVVIQNKNGGFNLLLKKTFNPAGLATPDQESVILSLFEPKAEGTTGGQATPNSGQYTNQQGAPLSPEEVKKQQSKEFQSPNPPNPVDDFDDDISF